jgi:hypothetical protein
MEVAMRGYVLLRRSSFGLAAMLAGLAAVQPAMAQRVSLAPTVGVYIPTEELLKAASGQEFKQEIGIAVGGRLGINFTPRLGFQAAGSYVPSTLRFALNREQRATDASLFTGVGKLTFFLIPPSRVVAFQINGGVAVVTRGGEAYRDLQEKTSVGGTAGAQLSFKLGPLPGIQLAAETFVYKQNLDGLAAIGEAPTQKDLQLSIGLGFPLGGQSPAPPTGAP